MEVGFFTDSYPPIQDGVTGPRVPGTEPGALASALLGILGSPEARNTAARRAAGFVRQTASLETMARRFMSLYRLVGEWRQHRDVGLPA